MLKAVMGSVGLLCLAACGGADGLPGATLADGHPQQVCDQQSNWARSGKADGGDIIITCPGNARPGYGAATPVHHNEYNRNADIYRAGWDGFMKVHTAK